jgi:transcriptional regulator with XRE-family HTH domain
MATLGERIRFLRELKGFNQTELSNAIGFDDKSTISKYEKNQRRPDIDTLSTIASIFEVSLNWLANGEIDIGICNRINHNVALFLKSKSVEKRAMELGVSEDFLNAIRLCKIMPSDAFLKKFSSVTHVSKDFWTDPYASLTVQSRDDIMKAPKGAENELAELTSAQGYDKRIVNLEIALDALEKKLAEREKSADSKQPKK